MARVAANQGPEDFVGRRSTGGLRIRVGGGLPRSLAGRITVGFLAIAGLAGFTGSLWGARSMLLHDPRLTIPSSDHIRISGEAHVSKAQMLSIFGEDVDHNLLTVPLAERKAQLESLPWVEHATVMRLLPNTIQVAIVERTPVAFVRQPGRIALVDGHGVLLEMTPAAGREAGAAAHYSFPVVTGILGADPLSTRAARMQLFTQFMGSLDAGQDKLSRNLSEVDLSNPEDLKALIPAGGAEVLVHFGTDDFLTRYRRFEKHLPEWRQQFPRLASVDLRYERDVVLEMQPGAPVPTDVASATPAAAVPVTAAARPGALKSAARKSAGKANVKAVAIHAPVLPAAAKLAQKVAVKPVTADSEVAFDAPVRHAPAAAAAKAKHSKQVSPR